MAGGSLAAACELTPAAAASKATNARRRLSILDSYTTCKKRRESSPVYPFTTASRFDGLEEEGYGRRESPRRARSWLLLSCASPLGPLPCQ